MSELGFVVIVQKDEAHLFRTRLKQNGLVDKSRVAKKTPNGCVAIPVIVSFVDSNCGNRDFFGIPFSIETMCLEKSRWTFNSPKDNILSAVKDLCKDKLLWTSEIEKDLPIRWEKHMDMLILPCDCFCLKIWTCFGSELWKIVATVTGCRRVARQKMIKNNGFRSPNVELLLGTDGWVEHIDNKIRYSFDVTRCMFSSGNVTEKLRVASFDCHNETVVDLYAGIGYFTLPYLVHAGASLVYACEWNPDAAEALKRNLSINGVEDRCVVLFGDNRQTCPRGVADRVNLGLIPSSEPGWRVACSALRPDRGGSLHVHGNVTSKLSEKSPSSSPPSTTADHCSDAVPDFSDDAVNNGHCRSAFTSQSRRRKEWSEWVESVRQAMELCLIEEHGRRWTASVTHVERVKSYAPHVDHVVVDLSCSPV